MIEADFKTHNIDNFTPAEVEATGADLADVQVELLIAFQKFRVGIRRRVKLIKNGMTTGNHRSPAHPNGTAGDFYLDSRDGPIKVINIFKAALDAGFRGIGIYWNGTTYSFHFDLRDNLAFWCGTKAPGKEWDYHSLLIDPKDL